MSLVPDSPASLLTSARAAAQSVEAAATPAPSLPRQALRAGRVWESRDPLLGWRGRTWASLLITAALLLSTGCSVLTPLVPGAAPVHTVDPNAPFVVVTVGGIPAATATAQGVAATIPDSTPLPKPELPARDAPTPRPAASPSLNRGGSAAAQAARPPDASIQTMAPSPVVSGP